MKNKPRVVMSQNIGHKLKRRDIIEHDQLYMITLSGQPITVSVIDEDITHRATPRYTNTVFSQLASAQNAADRLNQQFDTDAFVVRQVKYQD